MTQPVHNLDNLRLRVGLPTTTPTGLVNYLPNPHGDQGTWSWMTPVTGSALAVVVDGDDNYLELSASGSPSSTPYAVTSRYKVTPGVLAAARIDLGALTPAGGVGTLNVRLRVDFYDAANTAVGNSDYSAFVGTPGTTVYTIPVTVPSSAASAAVRVELYRGTGLVTTGDKVTFRAAMLTTGSAVALGYDVETSVRTNRVANPNFGAGTSGWTTDAANTLQRVDSGTPMSGTGFYLGVAAAGGNKPIVYYALPVAVGDKVTFTIAASAFGAETAYIGVASAPPISVAGGTALGTVPNNGMATFTWTATAAGDGFWIGTNGDHYARCYIDNVLEVVAGQDATYFDGDTPDVATMLTANTAHVGPVYDWTEAGISASTETITDKTVDFDYTDPSGTLWLDVLTETHSISISRTAMDVGTLAATLYEFTGDTSIIPDLNSGAPVALESLIEETWEPVYTGTLTDTNLNYALDPVKGLVATLSLSAVDATTIIASGKDLRVPGYSGASSGLLEGLGIRYLINGSTAQVDVDAAATLASGSTLEAFRVLRDGGHPAQGAGCYFACDRTGRWVGWRRDTLPATIKATFTDAWPSEADPDDPDSSYELYSALRPAFGLSKTCTVATVHVLTVTSTTTYGPYYDADALPRSGQHARDFTIARATPSDADSKAFADDVFAAHALPAVTVDQVAYPVTTARAMRHAATLDVLDRIDIELKDETTEHIITGVSHSITTDSWSTTYDLVTPETRIFDK